MPSPEERIKKLYQSILDCWNERDARSYANLFDEQGHVIGFDGSEMTGPDEINATLSNIFEDHMTARYIAIVRDVRFLSDDVAILRAVVGMIPNGKADINPAANAIQTLVASRQHSQWVANYFQNTPAQFHGRPDLAEALTSELRESLQDM